MIRALVILLFAAVPVQAQITIQEVTSPGGIKAWLVEEPAFPFVSMRVAFRGGTSLDQDDALGATNLMMGLLEEGTGDMDAAAFRRAAEALATNFSFDSSRDDVNISARFLTANADESIELLRRAIVEPAFNPVAVERVRNQVLANLRNTSTDPNTLAGRALASTIFGDHPYGRQTDGTIESVTALTRDDIIAAHRAALTRDHLIVGVVGDITAEELGPMLDTLLGDLPETGAAVPERTNFQASGGVTVIEWDTPQSVALWAQPGIERDDPDFIPAYVMMHILGGGGFGSRLTDEVREKRGLTYGIYSYVAALDHAEYFGGSVASANGSIAEAIDVVRAEWTRMAQEGISAEELQEAKAYLTGSYPLRFDSNAKIARALVSLQLDDLGIDYVNRRNDRVNALTVEQLNRIARERLDADALHFVVVGQPEGL